MRFLDVADLQRLDPTIDAGVAEALIEQAEALAIATAPCIAAPDFVHGAAVKAVLLAAVLRWSASDGVKRTMSAGPFSVTNDAGAPRFQFFPSELKSLRGLCGTSDRAFSVGFL